MNKILSKLYKEVKGKMIKLKDMERIGKNGNCFSCGCPLSQCQCLGRNDGLNLALSLIKKHMKGQK